MSNTAIGNVQIQTLIVIEVRKLPGCYVAAGRTGAWMVRDVQVKAVLQGRGRIRAGGSLTVQKGDSLMIPASTAFYSIEGSLHIYRASVPS